MCRRVKSSVCVWCQKQRHSVHSAFRESVMEAGRLPPFLPKHFDVLFIRGGKASGVFNSTTTATAAEISAWFFLGERGGTFVLEIMCRGMCVLWFISLNKLQIAQRQLLQTKGLERQKYSRNNNIPCDTQGNKWLILVLFCERFDIIVIKIAEDVIQNNYMPMK